MDKCPYCNGTGFRDGKICTCITGKDQELPQALKDVFGGVFGDIFGEKRRDNDPD